MLLISIISAIGVSLARPLMTIVLAHGKISTNQAHLSANVFIGFLVFSSAFSFYVYVVRLANLVGRTKEMFFINVVQNLINVILALFLIHLSPVIGLSIAFSASYFIVMPFALKLVSKNFSTSALNVKATCLVGLGSIFGALIGFICGQQFANIFVSAFVGLVTCALVIAIFAHFAKEEIKSLVKVFYNRRQSIKS